MTGNSKNLLKLIDQPI